MDRPDLDTSKMVTAAMNMRQAAATIIQLETINSTSREHQASINQLASIIGKQQDMIAHLVEHYIRLAELLDQIYGRIDSVITEAEKQGEN